jgi:GTP:adenosylcobinamide-phosphate guanylyltransferase/aminoglycoside phosphotransferase
METKKQSYIKYIVIQAGGKGTRLGHFTRNKPKGLVPVNNTPVIFHLFKKFPDKKFIIIGDYKHDVLENYLEAFADIKYITVRSYGSGTCAGIREAVEYIPGGESFMLIWSDLILAPDTNIEILANENYIGISKDFECRWSFINGIFEESPSKENGVAGLFVFTEKARLDRTPESGEFVRFLKDEYFKFKVFNLHGTKEVGTIAGIETAREHGALRCRNFNKIEITEQEVTKLPLDDLGRQLARREIAWYKETHRRGFRQTPEIVSFQPLVMRRITGQTVFQTGLDDAQKKHVIDNIVYSLKELHGLYVTDADCFSLKEAYYAKTLKRIDKARYLIPFADKEEIIINERKCKNIYFYRDKFRALTQKLFRTEKFTLIHGDCTFSNTMIDGGGNIVFIDPRGYFGFTELYGDPVYDWAKVYYSINGDYDQFNNGNFALAINRNSVSLDIASNGWQHLTGYYLDKIKEYPASDIRLIHAIIWLSLTTYAWEDYDSVCGAFYNGLMLLDEFLRHEDEAGDVNKT